MSNTATLDSLSHHAAGVPGATRRLLALVRTGDDVAPLLLRVALGGVMLPHGAQKALGWFGGPGLEGTLGFFRDALGVPAPITLLVIAAELLGAVALLLGAGTRVAAAGIGAVMVGAALMVHRSHGFFMNWFGAQQGEGFEFHLLALGMAAALVVAGGGRASVDGFFWRRTQGRAG